MKTFTIIVAVGLLLWWQSCCLSGQHQEIHEVLGYVVEEGHATRKALAYQKLTGIVTGVDLPGHWKHGDAIQLGSDGSMWVLKDHSNDSLTSRTWPLDVETGEVMPFSNGDLTLDEKGRWIIFSTTLGGKWWRLVPVPDVTFDSDEGEGD